MTPSSSRSSHVALGMVLVFSGLATVAHGAERLAKDLDIPARRDFPVDTSVNPCDDFYAYSCNLVTKTFELPSDSSYWRFAFDDGAERLRRAKVKYLADLKQKSSKELRPGRETLLATVYKSCLNVDARKREERELVAATKKRLAAVRDNRSLALLLGKNMLLPEPNFVSFNTMASADNPDVYDLLLEVDLLLLPEKSYYENPDLVKEYTEVVATLFTEAGLSDAKERAARLMEMQTRVAKSWFSPADERQIVKEKHYIGRADLQRQYPHLNWRPFLENVPPKTKMRIYSPATLAVANELLAKESVDTLKDLYAVQAWKGRLKEAYPKFDGTKRDFETKNFGMPKVVPPLEERCTRVLTDSYTNEIDAELLPVVFPNFPREKAVDVAESVRAALMQSIQSNKWLSEPARTEAMTKIRTARLFIGAPDTEKAWYFNPPHMVSENGFRKNLISLYIAQVKRDLEETLHPIDRTHWRVRPLSVGAAYFFLENTLAVPIGILQYPFFDVNGSREANLGAIGAVMAHELGHAIDDKNSAYDSKGALRTWMLDSDKKVFSELTKPLIAQADASGHIGSLVLGEVIGDLVGVTTAYDAAFPGGKGTIDAKKEFFLAWGRTWCSVFRPGFDDYLKKNDPHPLGVARVNEQMKHQRGFAETFQCKAENKLVLPDEKRIRIW